VYNFLAPSVFRVQVRPWLVSFFPDGSINFAVFQGMHAESVVLCLDDDDDDDDDDGVEKPPLAMDLEPYVNMNHAFDHGLLKKEP
jgi:hypothetical protein